MQDKFFSEYELSTEKSVRPSFDGSNVEALRIRQKSFSGTISCRSIIVLMQYKYSIEVSVALEKNKIEY